MKRKIAIGLFLLFFLFIFSAPKAFARCSFSVQSTYTTADDIQITADGLTPQKFYSLWVQKTSNQIPYISGNPKYVNSANSTFSVGKLAPGKYGFQIIGKETADQKSKMADNCLGKTADGFSIFTVSPATAPIPGQPTVPWMLNGNTPPECIQDARGTFNTKAECEKTISLNTSSFSNLPPPPPPPCAKWVFAYPVDSPSTPTRLNGTVIPDNSGYDSDKIKFGKCAAVDTAIGKIDTDPAGFVKRIFSFVLGIAGGIALILIIISGYKFMTSQGNPEAVKGATEQVTSAIVGLLFIIFAFVILQIIGVDILRIPGFTK